MLVLNEKRLKAYAKYLAIKMAWDSSVDKKYWSRDVSYMIEYLSGRNVDVDWAYLDDLYIHVKLTYKNICVSKIAPIKRKKKNGI